MATMNRDGLRDTVFRICDPKRGRTCSECGAPAAFGEATCPKPECHESLRAAMFGDLDAEEA